MKRSYLGNVYLVFVILLVFVLPAFAMDKLSSLLKSHDDLSGLLPDKQTYMCDVVSAKYNDSYKIDITVNAKTGNVKVECLSSVMEGVDNLDRTLRLKDSLLILRDKDLVKTNKVDKVISKYDEFQKYINTEFFLGGKKVRDESIKCDGNTIDPEHNMTFLQGMLLKGVRDFNADIVVRGYGKKVSADFQLLKVANLHSISPQYNVPDKVKEFLKQRGEALVYVMKVKGLAALVYPHKFYFAFTKEKPYERIATWGGPPKEVRYTLFHKGK